MPLVGCGNGSGNGGGGGSHGQSGPGFSLSLASSAVTVAKGGPGQTVQVTVTGENSFSGTVSITSSGLPAGVTMAPSSLSLAAGSQGAFTLSASSTATIEQQAVQLTGTSSTLTASTTLEVTVTGSLVADPFHPVGGSLVHGFYDESRQVLFATNLKQNELDVISGTNFSVQARVPVPQPVGIDQMADGRTLVIGTATQQIVTVDEDTLAVTAHPYTAAGNGFSTLFFPTVAALANGKVLMIGQEQGIASKNTLDGGQYLYEWDSNTNTFSQLEPTASSGAFEVDSLARSADHQWAVFSADQFYLYSSAADSLATAPIATVDPPSGANGVRGYALNPDGSKIAVASAGQVTFLGRSFLPLGSTPLPAAFPTSGTAVQFSADGQKLYLQYGLPVALEVVDATRYSALGYLSGTVVPDNDSLERLLANDSLGRAYVGIDGGLRLVDLTQSPVANPSSGTLSGPTCPALNVTVPLNTSEQIQITGAMTGVNVYIGGQPAPLVDGGTAVSVPVSAVSGPVDIECVDGNGNTTVIVNGVAYGVTPVGFSANLLPPTSTPEGYLFGFGFSSGQSQSDIPSVSFGGQPATNMTPLGDIGLGTLQGEAFLVPKGSPGQVTDVTVSDAVGTGTLASAATYYATPTILPASGILQLTFDAHRNLLYALKANEVDVLNAASLTWESPLKFPTGANGVYSAMALTPDGSKLVVAGVKGTTPQLLVLDPDGISSGVVMMYGSYSGSWSGSIATTNQNTVILPGTPTLMADLSTLVFSQAAVNVGGQVVRSSADGSILYSADLNSTGGGVYSFGPATQATQAESFGKQFWTDLAVSADGSEFAAVNASPDAAGDTIGFFNSSLQYVNANVYPDFSPADDTGVLGATFSPGGKVLVVALGDSIEFWDAAQGTLRGRLLTPEELHVMAYPEGAAAPMMALDGAGQTIYAVSASGLTVISLPEPLDQMPAMAWPLLRRGRGARR